MLRSNLNSDKITEIIDYIYISSKHHETIKLIKKEKEINILPTITILPNYLLIIVE